MDRFLQIKVRNGDVSNFLKEEALNKKQMQKNLRDKVYEAMVERSKNNNVEYIKYEKGDLK